jgi:hypothetical protein
MDGRCFEARLVAWRCLVIGLLALHDVVQDHQSTTLYHPRTSLTVEFTSLPTSQPRGNTLISCFIAQDTIYKIALVDLGPILVESDNQRLHVRWASLTTLKNIHRKPRASNLYSIQDRSENQ